MYYIIRMSHWRHTMVDGAEFWISCKWPAFLSSFSQGLILCSKKKILWVESRDFSQAEAEQIHKMTFIFTQNDIQGLFWVKIGFILWICSV